MDKKNDSLIIIDHENKRVVRWPRRNGANGQTIISDIDCVGLVIGNNEDFYVSDRVKSEIRRWKIGNTHGIIAAAENGKGNQLNQLNDPGYIFVDADHSVYVSDWVNHPVMKWLKSAKERIVVAGGQGQGNCLTQLSHPQGMIVDHSVEVYVSDSRNDRVLRWSARSKEVRIIIIGGNGEGQQLNQFNGLRGLSFDHEVNLYVVDWDNHRLQKFDVNSH